jgi:3-deoxy-D-manno-octulosonic-acid transferase
LIVAASTHHPEERIVLEAFLNNRIKHKPRIIFAPRHPERFDLVADILDDSGFTFARRSAPETEKDINAEIILLDSIGELRDVYSLADLVFVGGSLIPHGGQSVLEPSAAGKAIVTGPYTHNFDSVVKEFLDGKAIVQLPEAADDDEVIGSLTKAFDALLSDPTKRRSLGVNASSVMPANRGATEHTIKQLTPLIQDNAA